METITVELSKVDNLRRKKKKKGKFAKQYSGKLTTQLRNAASGIEADIVGSSTFNSHSLPEQKAYTASTKNYTFRTSDKCKVYIYGLITFIYFPPLRAAQRYLLLFCQFVPYLGIS